MQGFGRALGAGERIADDYEILGMAGAGGMGVVYRARDLKLERTVALKFLPLDLSENPQSRQRFLREARTASSLDHPNIGIIYGVEETADGSFCIVMAYYDGESLAERIRRGPVPPGEALDIAMQMARGLGEAHAHKIIHRDVKPSNVMLTSSGSVRIVDFGLASVVSAGTASQTGMTGTVAYMSPEQAMGSEVDQRTDIWALGCVLAEMLTGCNPFERETVPAMIVAVLNEAPRCLDALPAPLQQILYRALAKDVHQRYSTCAELLKDLEQLRAQFSDAPVLQESAKSRQWSAGDIRKAREHASQPLWGAPEPARRGKGWVRALGISASTAGLVALIFAVYMYLHGSRSGKAAESNARHIAVLPFDNLGNNPENAVLVQGLMDSLAGRLSNLAAGENSLWVIPTSEVRRLNISDPAAALKQLGATLAIKGSVNRNGQDVRLNLGLIDTRNLRQIGSADVDDRGGDLSTLQDEAVARLADLMKVHIASPSMHAGDGAVNPAAYEDYLKALGYLQRDDKKGNLDLAVASLQHAIKTDPQFALGFAELGETYRLRHMFSKNPKWLTEAQAYAQKAEELDSNIPAVYVTLGRVHEDTGKHDLAMQEFQHALELDPRNADAEGGLAASLENAGRIQEAEAAFQRAAALGPDSWKGYAQLGAFYDRQNKYAEAVRADEHAIQLTPDNAQVYANLGGAITDSADPALLPKGEQALRKSIELNPTYAAYANLGNLLLLEHRAPEAADALERALTYNESDYNVWNSLMMADEWQKKDAQAAVARQHAQSLAEQAVKLQPHDAQAQSILAYLYAMSKSNGDAATRIQTALTLAPDDPVILSNVGEAYEIMGDRSRALTYIHKALQKGYPLDQIRDEPTLQSLLQDPSFRPPSK